MHFTLTVSDGRQLALEAFWKPFCHYTIYLKMLTRFLSCMVAVHTPGSMSSYYYDYVPLYPGRRWSAGYATPGCKFLAWSTDRLPPESHTPRRGSTRGLRFGGRCSWRKFGSFCSLEIERVTTYVRYNIHIINAGQSDQHH